MFSIRRCCNVLKDVVKNQNLCLVPAANYLQCKLPPNYENVEFPERRRLKPIQKGMFGIYNKPLKMHRNVIDIRGPDKIGNKFQYGKFGVQALQGGLLKFQHIEDIRLFIIRRLNEDRMFAMWRIDQPWKSFTKKGKGVRMGSRKGAISFYAYPVKAEKILLEIGGHCEYEEVQGTLEHIARNLPFKARAVSVDTLKQTEAKEKEIQEQNLNPFSFKHCVRKNFLGIQKELSPYDYMWHGKYR